MMRIYYTILSLSFLGLSACKKNENATAGTPSPVTPSNLLVKIISKSGNDSTVIDYTYDANKRLILVKNTKLVSGTTDHDIIKITRDNWGVITRIVETADYLAQSGIDSLPTIFNSSLGRYLYSIMYFTQGAVSVRDTVWYTYDANGKIMRDQHYQYVSGVPFVQIFRHNYIYSPAGNVDSVNEYDYSSGVYTLSNITAYNYDTRVNPLQLNNDAILLYMFSLQGANNATKTAAIFIGNPSYNNSTTVVYTYRNDDRPLTSVSTVSPSGKIYNDIYYYQ